MGIKVQHGNVVFECDTVEEALQIGARLKNSKVDSAETVTEKHGGAGNSRWTEQRYSDFCRYAKGQQKKILEALLESSDGKTDKQLLQLLGMTGSEGKMLGGVLAGMAKNAKKAGVSAHELYTKHRVDIGDDKTFEYKITDSFKQAHKQFGKIL